MNSKAKIIAACSVGMLTLAGVSFWLIGGDSALVVVSETKNQSSESTVKYEPLAVKAPVVSQADKPILATTPDSPTLVEKSSQHDTFDIQDGVVTADNGTTSFSSIPDYLEKQENLKRISFDDTCSYAKCKYEDNVLVAKLGQNDSIDDLLTVEGVESVTPVFSGPTGSNTELSKWVNIRLKAGTELKSSAVTLVNSSEVSSVHPNYIRKLDVVLSPQKLVSGEQSQWHHAAINTEAAWQHLKSIGTEAGGSPKVVVAVIDTGIDVDHPDLVDAHWVNLNEIPDNGIDDDGNGVIDDIHGANFLPNPADGLVEDNHGHGTHVAGLVGAKNTGEGVSGVAPNVQIMTIKAGQSTGSLSSVDIAEAIIYAAMNGADVINMSFGGSGQSALEEDALAAAFSTSVLIASAGNDGLPNEAPCKPKPVAFYPASYPYVVGIQASDSSGKLTDWSNFDCNPLNEVEYELTAPGSNILSTVPGGNFAAWDGTSMSAPIAAGVAALIRTKFPDKGTYRSRFIAGQLTANSSLDALASLTTFPEPKPRMTGFELLDSTSVNSSNDGDLIADAGETVQLAVKVRNYKGTADNLTLTVSAENRNGVIDPYITFVDSTSNFGSLGSYVSTDNGISRASNLEVESIDDPIEIIINPNTPNNHVVSLKFTLEATNGLDASDTTTYTYSQYNSLTVQRGRTMPSILTDGFVISNDNLWILDKPVLVVEGAKVTVEAGTKIQFYSNNPRKKEISELPYIYVKGRLTFNGTVNNPINIYPNELFSGFAVPILSDADNAIILKYTHIVNPYLHNTDSDNYPDYPATSGAISIDHSLFTQNDKAGVLTRIVGGYFVSVPARVNLEDGQGRSTNSVFKNLTYEYASNSKAFSCQSGAGNLFTGNNVVAGFKEERYNSNNCEFFDSVFVNNPYSTLVKFGGADEGSNRIKRNAFLNQWNTYPDKDGWLKFSIPDGQPDLYLTRNYWGGVVKETIHQAISDRSDGLFNAGNIIVEPSLSVPSESTYPFVVDIKLYDAESNERTSFGAETIYAEVTYNRPMGQGVEPTVSFGPAEPYSNANFVNGEWINSKTWRGEVQVIPSLESGLQYLCADGARAADDAWLVAGRDCGRFTFDVTGVDVKSIALNATAEKGGIKLSWQQDDYDLLQGYNIYRSKFANRQFQKISQQLITAGETTYTDSSVVGGQTYYYYFTASTDSKESEPSNTVSATALDDVAPVIEHTTLEQANYGTNYIIRANVSDNVEVESVSVKIRHSGDSAYQTREMVTFGSGLYTVSIEGSYTTKNFEYFLLAVDDAGNQTRFANGNSPVNVSVALPDNGDADGDGVNNGMDVFPFDPNESLDSDKDGKGDNADTDDDNDGASDEQDAFPNDSTESKDTDSDGVGNNTDSDRDNDGMPDSWELAYGLNPLSNDANSDPDGDNVKNINEYRLGTNPNKADTDGDGITDDLDLVKGSGFWGSICNVVNSPTAQRRWGIDQYDAAQLPDATANALVSVTQNRKIQSVACDPSGTSVLYSMKQSVAGDYEIYELDLKSQLTTQITDNDTDDVDVTRSLDGRTIAWQKRLPDDRQAIELRIFSESGGYTTKTLASATPFVQPSLSPNGKWLAFVQLRANFFAVMRYDIANNKYKEIHSIARRKKLYHPSITDDGNKVGWSERVSKRRYRVKDVTENTITDILNDASGIEHAVLSGDGKQVIYSINQLGAGQAFITSIETLEITAVGDLLSGNDRYLASNWSGAAIGSGFTKSDVAGRTFTSTQFKAGFVLNADGTGTRYTLGGSDSVNLTWWLANKQLILTEKGEPRRWVISLLATNEDQFTVSVIAPDAIGGIERIIDIFNRESTD